MLSWEIALGLMIISFFVPFLILRARLTDLRERVRISHEERKQLRAMLQDVEEHLYRDKSLFLESLSVPFLLLRRSGRLEMGNRAAANLLGIDTSLHSKLLNLITPGPFCDTIRKATQCTEFQHIDFTREKNGEKRYYRASVTPLPNDSHLVGMVIHDLTELQRTQIIRREFVANASHELRTPLTIIRGYLETLLEDQTLASDPDARLQVLGVMKKHADRIVRLVEDMLTLSRMEDAGPTYLRQEPFDFVEIVGEVHGRLENAFRAQKATCHIHISPTPFLLMGDKFYWAQILYNLVENSLKNNLAPGLQVTISASLNSQNQAVITISDDGIGIQPAAIPFIFNRFYRANTSPKIKGTGLGLAIVKHAVELHHGSIHVESIPNEHTQFTITLPASEPA